MSKIPRPAAVLLSKMPVSEFQATSPRPRRSRMSSSDPPRPVWSAAPIVGHACEVSPEEDRYPEESHEPASAPLALTMASTSSVSVPNRTTSSGLPSPLASARNTRNPVGVMRAWEPFGSPATMVVANTMIDSSRAADTVPVAITSLATRLLGWMAPLLIGAATQALPDQT